MTYRRLLAAAFLTNGLALLGIKAVSASGLRAAVPVALVCTYATASVPALASVAAAGRRLQWKSLGIGAMGGLGSAIGTAALAQALKLAPGHVAFPVCNGGGLLLIAIVGRFLFGEKVGPYGIAGIICGAAAIVLLGR